MSSSSSSDILSLLGFLHIGEATASHFGVNSPQEAEQQLRGLYNVAVDLTESNDPLMKGNCVQHKSKLITAYQEVSTMIDKAVDALDDLAMVGEPESEGSDKVEYMRKLDAFKAMFGSFDREGLQAQCSVVKNHYVAVLNAHQLKPGQKLPRWRIRCGEDFVRWYGPDADHPLDPRTSPEKRKKLSKRYTMKNPPPGMPKFKNGAWLAENLDSSYTFLDPDEIGGRTEKIEAPGLDAESFPLKKLPILSPGAFESENSSITEISRRIQEGRKFDDYFPTLTQTWLHHMFHLALNVNDPLGKNPGRMQHIHGWSKAKDTATKSAGLAVRAPENLAIFAAMMYLSDWRWDLDGKAHRIESDPFRDPSLHSSRNPSLYSSLNPSAAASLAPSIAPSQSESDTGSTANLLAPGRSGRCKS